MRNRSSWLSGGVALAILVFGASSASAFALDMTLNPASDGLTGYLHVSDVVMVDIYLDADPGLEFLSVGVLFDDDGILHYEPGLTSMASYILYDSGPPASSVVAFTSPPIYWLGTPQVPGKYGLLVEYLESSLETSPASGNDIWLTTLVFHVADVGDGSTSIDLTLDISANFIKAYGNELSASTPVTGSFTFNVVPEPSTAVLFGVALVGALMISRRGEQRSENWERL